MEFQSLIGILNQKEVDYKTRIERGLKMRDGTMTQEETEEIQKEEQIVTEKMKEVEQTKVNVNFFSKHAMKLIKKSTFNIR